MCLVSSRDRRDRHRSKSRDSSSRADKSVTIQTPGEPLLDAESTRGDDRVSHTVSMQAQLLIHDLYQQTVVITVLGKLFALYLRYLIAFTCCDGFKLLFKGFILSKSSGFFFPLVHLALV